MKHIIKYKLHGSTVPYFVEDGGFYVQDGWYYGISKDDFDCNIPSDAVKLTEKNMKDLIKAMPMKKTIEVELTEEEKYEQLYTILDKHGLKEKK